MSVVARVSDGGGTETETGRGGDGARRDGARRTGRGLGREGGASGSPGPLVTDNIGFAPNSVWILTTSSMRSCRDGIGVRKLVNKITPLAPLSSYSHATLPVASGGHNIFTNISSTVSSSLSLYRHRLWHHHRRRHCRRHRHLHPSRPNPRHQNRHHRHHAPSSSSSLSSSPSLSSSSLLLSSQEDMKNLINWMKIWKQRYTHYIVDFHFFTVFRYPKTVIEQISSTSGLGRSVPCTHRVDHEDGVGIEPGSSGLSGLLFDGISYNSAQALYRKNQQASINK